MAPRHCDRRHRRDLLKLTVHPVRGRQNVMSMSYTTGRLHTITGGRQTSDTSDVALLRSISAPSPALAGLASGGLGPGHCGPDEFYREMLPHSSPPQTVTPSRETASRSGPFDKTILPA